MRLTARSNAEHSQKLGPSRVRMEVNREMMGALARVQARYLMPNQRVRDRQ
jgi:hypothetical protein